MLVSQLPIAMGRLSIKDCNRRFRLYQDSSFKPVCLSLLTVVLCAGAYAVRALPQSLFAVLLTTVPSTRWPVASLIIGFTCTMTA